MKKAVYISTFYDKRAERVEQEYEYRGHRYIVYTNLKGHEHMTLRGQHQEEQRKIDEAIENEEKEIQPQPVDLDAIWKANGWA